MAIYTPHTQSEVRAMLKKIGVKKIDELFTEVPNALKVKDLDMPKGISEMEAEKQLNNLANKNKKFLTILRGAGSYNHYIPAVVRSMSSRSEFVTAYTPYQAEISQGTLQSIFEYQSMMCNLTGMDVCNASHYDGATATAEAALMTKEKSRNKIMLAPFIKEQTLKVLKTYIADHDIILVTAPSIDGRFDLEKAKAMLDNTFAAIILEQPSFIGIIEDAKSIGELAHSFGAKFIMSTYPTALGILKKPIECGADIATGEAQSLGLPLNYGGAYIGYMCATKAMQRKLPGRIVGETVDRLGNKAYVLTLQAREQHIRREKASSNICSNQAHCALTVGMYLAVLGQKGLNEVAVASATNAHYLCEILEKSGLKRKYSGEFFNEFVTTSTVKASDILDALAKKGILGGLPINEYDILWCATEVVTFSELNKVATIVKGVVKC